MKNKKENKMNTEVHITILRNKFENQDPMMKYKNDRHYWISFSNWLVENHIIVAKIKM